MINDLWILVAGTVMRLCLKVVDGVGIEPTSDCGPYSARIITLGATRFICLAALGSADLAVTLERAPLSFPAPIESIVKQDD